MASDSTARLPLEGRRILLGITGSIAAYKAAVLCRLLKTAGAEVRVVMTPLAKQFITPLTMATLSKNPILVEFFDPENGAWNSHVSLGEWADCYLIAPATAIPGADGACLPDAARKCGLAIWRGNALPAPRGQGRKFLPSAGFP